MVARVSTLLGEGNCALGANVLFNLGLIDIIIGWLFENGIPTQDIRQRAQHMPVQQITAAMASKDTRFVVRVCESVYEELGRI